MKRMIACALLLSCLAAVSAAPKKEIEKKELSIAVFVPGIVSGSPVYEMLASGVQKAVAEKTAAGTAVTVKIIEAGTQQSEWGNKLTSLVAEGTYDLFISSNPAMPEIINPISRQFAGAQFMVFDSWYEGNPNITTFRYNQREQAFISGYMSALVSSSSMKYANTDKKIGLIAGQEYPAMNTIILPAFLEGARAVDPAFTVDFRVVGNWYDAAKGAELARAMKGAGVDVIMPISGGANQGVLSAAKDAQFYVAWFDDNGYAKAPGYVVSSAVMAQERLAYEKTKEWIEGKIVRGKPSTVGFAGNYIGFVSDDPLFLETVPAELREKMQKVLESLKNGSLVLDVK